MKLLSVRFLFLKQLFISLNMLKKKMVTINYAYIERSKRKYLYILTVYLRNHNSTELSGTLQNSLKSKLIAHSAGSILRRQRLKAGFFWPSFLK